jgi:hypothetical protein
MSPGTAILLTLVVYKLVLLGIGFWGSDSPGTRPIFTWQGHTPTIESKRRLLARASKFQL